MVLDIESVLDNVGQILKTNLNKEVALVNAEKSDDVVLSFVSDNAYTYQSLDHEVLNYDPVILFGIIDIDNVNNGPFNQKNLTISIVVIAEDDADGEKMTRKMLRYQKALAQTIEKNWSSGIIGNKITIKNQLPAKIEGLNSSQAHRVVGIEIETSIA